MKSFKDRIKNKFNVAFAELDYQDKWQRTRIGVVTLNSHKKPVDSLLNKIIVDAQENINGEIIDTQIHYF